MTTPNTLHLIGRESTLPAEDIADSVLAARHYETLQQIIREIGAARTSDEALHCLYLLLHERYGLQAVALEVVRDATTYYRPYGEAEAISTAAAHSGASRHAPETARRVQVYPLECKFAPHGQIVFVLAPDSPVPDSLLYAGVSALTMLLDQEALARRVEASEQRARHRISEVATIYEIGQAIDQIELKRLLQLIVERAALLMDAQACSLMLVQEETGMLRVEASHGLPDDAQDQEQEIGQGIAGRVAQTEEPMLILDAARDPRLEGVMLRPDIGSSMLVPMKNQEGRILGVLSIRRPEAQRQRTAQDFDAVARSDLDAGPGRTAGASGGRHSQRGGLRALLPVRARSAPGRLRAARLARLFG